MHSTKIEVARLFSKEIERVGVVQNFFYHGFEIAIILISTLAPFGKKATCTVSLAGKGADK